jgi:hypothetical protein
MHILPLILSVFSYKQHMTDRYLRSLSSVAPRRFANVEIPKLAVSSSGELRVIAGETGLMAPDEVEAIRSRPRDMSAGPPRPATRVNPVTKEVEETNEIIGSYFASNEITHNGTDAWNSLLARLGENGIVIDEDRVAELSAGFYAERKMQEILGRSDKQRLRDELSGDLLNDEGGMLYNAHWVRELESHPDAENIAQECYDNLHKNFPRALGSDVAAVGKSITFDKNTIEVES